MAGEKANIETFQTPVESNYDKQDAEEYYKNGDIDELDFETLGNEKEEAAYSGEKISEKQLKKEAKENIRAFKAKKIGARGLSLSQFDAVA